MKPRRVGCLAFGLFWTAIFCVTIFVFAVGDPAPIDCTSIPHCNPYPPRWTDYILWIEVGALVLTGIVFYRAEMRGDD